MQKTILRMIKEPTTMMAMAGHLQKLAAMQLSQLDRAVLISVTLSLASSMMFLLAKCSATLLARLVLRRSQGPSCRLLDMATSTDGMILVFVVVVGVVCVCVGGNGVAAMTKDVLVLAAERIRQGGKKRRVKETGTERRMNGVGGGGGGGAAGVKLSQKLVE